MMKEIKELYYIRINDEYCSIYCNENKLNDTDKEISKNVFDELNKINLTETLYIPKEKQNEFKLRDISIEDIPLYFEKYKGTVIKVITDEQKDIKFLAETLKGFIEPMQLPADGQPNPALEKLQEIINRYS